MLFRRYTLQYFLYNLISSVRAAMEESKMEPFDYQGVSLRPSRWRTQYLSARDFHLSVSNDDILHGYRRHEGVQSLTIRMLRRFVHPGGVAIGKEVQV